LHRPERERDGYALAIALLAQRGAARRRCEEEAMRKLLLPILLAATACVPAAEAPPQPAGTVAPLSPSAPRRPLPPPPSEPSPVFMAAPEGALQPTGDPSLDAWLRRALYEGGPAWRPLLLRAFAGIRANPLVLQTIEPEPGDVAAFVRRYVTPARIAEGQRLFAELRGRPLFQGEQRVPTEYLLALWGAYSDYGIDPPPFDMIEAIANAEAHGRGAGWTEFQLYEAVRILADGWVPRSLAKAYGDGRIGQVRWLPEHYLQNSEDGDGDGRIDVWTNRADILRNLQQTLPGMELGVPVIAEISRPPPEMLDPSGRRVPGRRDIGAIELRRADGQPWGPEWQRQGGRILTPFGPDGPLFLVTRNFQILNFASPFRARFADPANDGFALAVALLAERIAGRAAPTPPIG
jgi:membrane-bound lytic murein transglycosylase B